ncbi:MAG: cytochrome c oxidase subunit 3 family protein [Panacagrimonas sp.]
MTASTGLKEVDPSQTGARVHLPGEVGIWVFILGDMIVFGLFFVTFMYYRGQDRALFAEAQTLLNQNWGAINTLLLLASSWFVVMGLNAARQGAALLSTRLLWSAWLCGFGFVIVKYFEWGEKLRAGITLTTNDFFMYYFVFTGIHLLHLIIGLGVLVFLISLTRRRAFDAKGLMILEGGACFWHLVDLLWIVLFAVLYLVK